MLIREAIQQDFEEIGQLVTNAFGQDIEAKLTSELRLCGAVRYEFVATIDETIVGHILMSELDLPKGCTAIGPVSAHPDHQRQGIGSALVNKSIRAAKSDGWSAIFLLGNPDYYQRFGFSTDAAARFRSDYPPEYLMALELESGALITMVPQMQYAEPFRTIEDV